MRDILDQAKKVQDREARRKALRKEQYARERAKHKWGRGTAVPKDAGEAVMYYRYYCKRCGAAGLRFPENPHIVPEHPGQCP